MSTFTPDEVAIPHISTKRSVSLCSRQISYDNQVPNTDEAEQAHANDKGGELPFV